MCRKLPILLGVTLALAALILGGCGRNRDTEIEVAVALTQTAVALSSPAASGAAADLASGTPTPGAESTTAAAGDAASDGAAFALSQAGDGATSAALLPAPLYFIERETQQVAVLESDGVSLEMVTSEVNPVRDFDIAPDGDRLAYIVDNRLVELDLASGRSTTLVAGESIVGTDVADRFERRLHEPHYSPDGSQIAFGRGGVFVLDLSTSSRPVRVLASSPYPQAGDAPSTDEDPLRFFWPKGWSPDGEKLLVEFAYLAEGGGLAIYDLTRERLVDFSSDEPEAVVCCDPAWSPDSQELYVASDLLVYGRPGLSVVDAASGVVSPLAIGLPGETQGTYQFFRAPFAAANGLLVFRNETGDLSQQMQRYRLMFVSDPDAQFTPLRNDPQPLEGEAVWTADASGVAYLTNIQIQGERSTGTVVWLPADGAPAELPIVGEMLRFPRPPGTPDALTVQIAPTPDEDEVSAALSAYAASLWGYDALGEEGASSGNGPGIEQIDSFPVRVQPDAPPLWASHTVGLRDFESDQFHTVGLFTREDEAWRELARFALGGDVDPNNAEPAPDFLDKGAVTQVFVDPTHIWLSIEGGAGAHSGTLNLLSFDGEILRSEASAFSASPGVARFADLNGDGNQEVILDATDYYVFCYACGVRLVHYDVLRWNETRMEPVMLQPLPDTASDELTAINAQALRLAEGGLWKDAWSAVQAGRALDEDDPTFGWNEILIGLNAQAKRENAQDDNGYPILGHIFYGDYAAAVDLMRDLDPASIYSLTSPLIVGSPAEGSVELLADWITRTTASALAVVPDLAPTRYLRGWAGYLETTAYEAALPDTARAAAVDPDDALYAVSVAFLLDAETVTPSSTPSGTPTSAPMDGSATPNATTARPTPTLGAPAAQGNSLTARTGLNVRAGPGTGAAAIGELRAGARVSVTGRIADADDPWWQIRFAAGEDGLGWVSGNPSLVEVDANDAPILATPIQEAPPTPIGAAGVGRLFFSAQDRDRETVIYQLGADGTVAPVVEMAAQPAIQPGGNRLAFYSTRDDMLGLGGYDLESGRRLRFAFNIEDALPTWDPKTQRIAFASTRYGDGRSRLYTVWADGQGDALDIGYGQDPDWHPSQDLLVMKGCDQSGSKCGLWTLRPDGSDRRRLTENANDARPVWTRDGQAIVFMNNDRDGNWELYRLDVADGQITRLTNHPGNDGLPAISPDGSRIAFLSDRGGGWSIQTMPLSGGPAQQLYAIGDDLVDWLSQGIAWER